jgi:hypothetical protein
LKEFDRKPSVLPRDATKLNPIFGVLEQEQKLSLVPRKPLQIRNCVAGIEQVVQPPAIDINPEAAFRVEYLKQLSQRTNPFNKRQSEYSHPQHKFDVSQMKIKPSYAELERMGCASSINHSRFGKHTSFDSGESRKRTKALLESESKGQIMRIDASA